MFGQRGQSGHKLNLPQNKYPNWEPWTKRGLNFESNVIDTKYKSQRNTQSCKHMSNSTCWPLWMIAIPLFIQRTLLLRLWLQRRLFALFVPQQNYQLNFLQRHCKHPLSSAKLRWSVAQQVQEGVLIKPGFKVQRSRLSTLAQIPSVAANQGL